MSEQPVKGAAELAAKDADKDLTGRAVNEQRLQSEGKADKLRGDARTAAGSETGRSDADGFSGSAASQAQDDLNRD
jgi:uncharacterized protein YjbJ (UPF0337 family)